MAVQTGHRLEDLRSGLLNSCSMVCGRSSLAKVLPSLFGLDN